MVLPFPFHFVFLQKKNHPKSTQKRVFNHKPLPLSPSLKKINKKKKKIKNRESDKEGGIIRIPAAMADDFQLGSGSWWDTSSRNRFESGTSPASSSISTTLNAIASYGWTSEMVDMKSRSTMDSTAVSMEPSAGGGGGGVLSAPDLQMMGLGLSSPSMDWNQALL